MMPAIVSSPPQAACRRRCSWCRCDLGPLHHPSQHDSYGICANCTQIYFAYLYEVDRAEDATAEILLERAIGE
jgi:hypothetical protein